MIATLEQQKKFLTGLINSMEFGTVSNDLFISIRDSLFELELLRKCFNENKNCGLNNKR